MQKKVRRLRPVDSNWRFVGVIMVLVVATTAAIIFSTIQSNGLSGNSLVVVRDDSDGPALSLDPTDVAARAPGLGKLLDEATSAGIAKVGEPKAVVHFTDYLDQEARKMGYTGLDALAGMVEWRGAHFKILMIADG